MSRIKPDLSLTCDQCKTATASLMHMFRLCPKILGLWSSIFETYSKIIGQTIHPSPLISLFGVIVEYLLNKHYSNMTACRKQNLVSGKTLGSQYSASGSEMWWITSTSKDKFYCQRIWWKILCFLATIYRLWWENATCRYWFIIVLFRCLSSNNPLIQMCIMFCVQNAA